MARVRRSLTLAAAFAVLTLSVLVAAGLDLTAPVLLLIGLAAFAGAVVVGRLLTPAPESPSTGVPSPFGAWMIAARCQRGWSQVDLARVSGVSETMIADLETGQLRLVDNLVDQRIRDAFETQR